MIRKWVQWSLINLFIIGVLGCLLRWILFAPIDGINFRFFLHAHSHVAFLGWIFNALFVGLVFAYIPYKAYQYKLLFWLLQATVLGMLISFPVQGYAVFSIIFSTLHIFLSYWFTVKFLRDTSAKKLGNKPVSILFIRWSLFFMVLSSIGPFALGAIMAQGLSGSQLYQLAIYFYLHFQYDGWFSFAVFGLFFKLLEDNFIFFFKSYAKKFLWMMAIACMPAYALSALWTQPDDWVYHLGFVAASLQLIAFVFLLLLLFNVKHQLKLIMPGFNLMMMQFAFGALAIKFLLQFSSAFPAIADLAFRVRSFTVGYLHIVFIGFVSVFILAWLGQVMLIDLKNKWTKAGIIVFLAGFIFSDAIIFLQPVMLMMKMGILPYGNQALFIISLLMPLGTGMLLVASKKISGKALKKQGLKAFNTRKTELFKKY